MQAPRWTLMIQQGTRHHPWSCTQAKKHSSPWHKLWWFSAWNPGSELKLTSHTSSPHASWYTLGKELDLSNLLFSHRYNGNHNSTSPIGLFWGLNEAVDVKHLAWCWEQQTEEVGELVAVVVIIIIDRSLESLSFFSHSQLSHLR